MEAEGKAPIRKAFITLHTMKRYPVYAFLSNARKIKFQVEFLLEFKIHTNSNGKVGGHKGFWCTYKQLHNFTKELTNNNMMTVEYPFPQYSTEGRISVIEVLNTWFNNHPISANLSELESILRSLKSTKLSDLKPQLLKKKTPRSDTPTHTPTRKTSHPSLGSNSRGVFKSLRKQKLSTSKTEASSSESTSSLYEFTSPRSTESSRDSLPNLLGGSDSIERLIEEKQMLVCINNAFHHFDSTEDIVEIALNRILKYTKGSDLFFIRKADQIVLDGAVSREKVWSLLQSIKLSQIQLFSSDILNHSTSLEEPVILHGMQQVGATGSDYYVCNIPESVLCLPVFLRKEFQGAIYITNDTLPNGFDGLNIDLLATVLLQLIGAINQDTPKVPIVNRMKKSKKVTANQRPNLMQDTMLVYDEDLETWKPHFVVLTEEELLIFSSPFDFNPTFTLKSKNILDIRIPSGKNYSKEKYLLWPEFPKKFKTKKSLIYISCKDEDCVWLAVGSLRVAKIWREELKTNSDVMSKRVVAVTNSDIPTKIRIDPDEIEIEDVIGRGGAATVYSGCWNQEQVAIKVLFDTIDQSEVKEFFAEMKILHTLRHPNIVSLMGGFINSNGRPSIVFEFAERGNLNSVLYDPLLELSGSMKLRFMKQICQALHYLHSFETPIIHRDLKPANILVTEDWKTKIADFGLARRCNSTLTMAQGTVKWMAPEILSNQPYSIKADIYSLGLVMWEIIEQKPFFEEFKFNSQIEIQVVNHNARPPFSEAFPPVLVDIISSCWSADPIERPTAEEVLKKLKTLPKDLAY